jgi:hypothetical protein
VVAGCHACRFVQQERPPVIHRRAVGAGRRVSDRLLDARDVAELLPLATVGRRGLSTAPPLRVFLTGSG